MILTFYLLFQACVRIGQWTRDEMEPVDGKLMSIIAAIGILVNVALVFVLVSERNTASEP